MKTVIALVVTVLIVAPASLAVGVAKDPRLPALQRRVKALETQSVALQASADAFNQGYLRENIAGRVFGLCGAVLNTGRHFSAAQLAAEPVFLYYITQVYPIPGGLSKGPCY